jgi:CheY-like chemotaxis protein
MGGCIGVESRPGQGATFWFTCDLTEVPAPAEVRPIEFSRLRILIVDDNATNRQILESQVQALGCEVRCAEDGPLALRALLGAVKEARPYHVALLDRQMPDMDGIMLARAIRSQPELNELQLILLSSHAERPPLEQLRSAGFAGHLLKPVRRSQLADRLVHLLSPLDPGSRLVMESGQPASVRSLHLLVAEDNEVNQRVSVMLLQRLGYQVDVATNGQEAIDKVREHAYDGVLMDCQMPVVDGFEATRQIRRFEGSARHTVIVAMTAGATSADKAACLDAGMDDYVTKPVRAEELKRVLVERLQVASN